MTSATEANVAMYFQSEKDWYKRALGNADASLVFLLLVLFPSRVVVLLVGENEGFCCCCCSRCRSRRALINDWFSSFASSPSPSAIRITLLSLFSLSLSSAYQSGQTLVFGKVYFKNNTLAPPRIFGKKPSSRKIKKIKIKKASLIYV